MIDEHMIICGLVQSVVDRFRSDLVKCIDDFYKSYNPIKSLDRTYVVKLISNVYNGLEKVFNEVKA